MISLSKVSFRGKPLSVFSAELFHFQSTWEQSKGQAHGNPQPALENRFLKNVGHTVFAFATGAAIFTGPRQSFLEKDSLMNGLLRFLPPAGEDPGQEE